MKDANVAELQNNLADSQRGTKAERLKAVQVYRYLQEQQALWKVRGLFQGHTLRGGRERYPHHCPPEERW